MEAVREFVAPFCPLHGNVTPCFVCVLQTVVDQVAQNHADDNTMVLFMRPDENEN